MTHTYYFIPSSVQRYFTRLLTQHNIDCEIIPYRDMAKHLPSGVRIPSVPVRPDSKLTAGKHIVAVKTDADEAIVDRIYRDMFENGSLDAMLDAENDRIRDISEHQAAEMAARKDGDPL